MRKAGGGGKAGKLARLARLERIRLGTEEHTE
jgi:hypothetical protein